MNCELVFKWLIKNLSDGHCMTIILPSDNILKFWLK